MPGAGGLEAAIPYLTRAYEHRSTLRFLRHVYDKGGSKDLRIAGEVLALGKAPEPATVVLRSRS
ncbi:hypothetical protein GCM10023175_04240 [Pseudonocardia xishanensis]|uniref:Uncharacterized protein n=1 Tax=Pseudonocardia xishanensis TaxID=630995 RepID=A0ABP8RF04_9PSEU